VICRTKFTKAVFLSADDSILYIVHTLRPAKKRSISYNLFLSTSLRLW